MVKITVTHRLVDYHFVRLVLAVCCPVLIVLNLKLFTGLLKNIVIST